MSHLRFQTLLAFLAVAACLAGPAAGSDEVTSMNDYLWQNRPALVFVPASDHPLLAAQRAALSGQAAGLEDREIVVIEVVGNDVAVDGQAARGLTAQSLRRRYGIAESEAVALLERPRLRRKRIRRF